MRNVYRFSLLALVLGLLAVVPAAAEAPGKVVDRYLAAYSSSDVARVSALYTDDAFFVDVSQRHEAAGRAAVTAMFEHLRGMHKTMKVEEKRRATSGGLVTIEVVYSGILDCAALGLPGHADVSYTIPAVLLFEIENGRIHRQTDYLDYRTLAELKASLQPPAAPAK